MRNKFRNILSIPFSKAVFLFLLLVMIWTTFNIKRWKQAEKAHPIIDWDVTSYYGYLPATFIHQDLTFEFLNKDTIDYAAKHQFWPETAPNGGKVIKTTMGMSFLYAPFFFLAHGFAHVSKYEPNGFSQPYEFFLVLSCLFYLFIGLWYVRKILLRFYSETITGITMIAILLGTNLFYYSSTEPAMSHAYSFGLIAVFIYQVLIWHENHQLKRAVYIGLIGGLFVLVRPVNILIFLFPLLLNVTSFRSFIDKMKLFAGKWLHIVVIGVLAFLVILPQLIYWKYITGNWFFNSYVGERFYFGNPHIMEGLFSYRKGWLVYTPIMILGLIGLYSLFKRNKALFLPTTLFVMVNIYVLYCWWSWWYGGGFGNRPMIDTYALMAIPLAGFIDFAWRKKGALKPSIIGLLLCFILLNLFQTIQRRRGIIHWDGMTKKAYWNVFLKEKLSEEDWKKQEEYIVPPDYEKAVKGEDEYSFEIF